LNRIDKNMNSIELDKQKEIDRLHYNKNLRWNCKWFIFIAFILIAFVLVYKVQCAQIDQMNKKFVEDGQAEKNNNELSCKCKENCCIKAMVADKKTQHSFSDSTKNIKLTDTINESRIGLDTSKRN